MVTNSYSRLKVGSGTFVLWFLAIACVVFWGLKLSAGSQVQAAPAMPQSPTVVDVPSLVRLLGGTEVVTVAKVEPTRYTLVGVLAGTRSGHGTALIEVDGKPAKPFRIGAQVADGLVLQSVGRREARLGASASGATSMTLQMPIKVAAASDTSPNVPSPPGTTITPNFSAPAPIQTPMMPGNVNPGVPTSVPHPMQSQ